jgi:hypothetical protein
VKSRPSFEKHEDLPRLKRRLKKAIENARKATDSADAAGRILWQVKSFYTESDFDAVVKEVFGSSAREADLCMVLTSRRIQLRNLDTRLTEQYEEWEMLSPSSGDLDELAADQLRSLVVANEKFNYLENKLADAKLKLQRAEKKFLDLVYGKKEAQAEKIKVADWEDGSDWESNYHFKSQEGGCDDLPSNLNN